MADENATRNKPGERWSEIRRGVRTYDLFLFRGGDFVSDAISRIEQRVDGVGTYTHAGMALRARDMPEGHRLRVAATADQSVFVLESTASGGLADNVTAVDDHRGHLGVQVRDMDQLVPAYDAGHKTHLAWLPLREGLRPQTTPEQLAAVVDRYRGIAYDAQFVELLAAAFPVARKVRDNRTLRKARSILCCCCCCCCRGKPESWLFCSELVAQVYKDVGVFPDTVVPADVLPTDFLPAAAAACGSGTPLMRTADSDGCVPWVFERVVPFHAG